MNPSDAVMARCSPDEQNEHTSAVCGPVLQLHNVVSTNIVTAHSSSPGVMSAQLGGNVEGRGGLEMRGKDYSRAPISFLKYSRSIGGTRSQKEVQAQA